MTISSNRFAAAQGSEPVLPVPPFARHQSRAVKPAAAGSVMAAQLPAERRRPHLYAAIFAVAIATGLAVNVLLGDAQGVGFNIVLALGVFLGGWFMLTRKQEVPRWRKLCAVGAGVYGAALAFRASEILFTVNATLLLGFLLLACSPAYTPGMKRAWVAINDLLLTVGNALFGPFYLLNETPWQRLSLKNRHARTASQILAGLGIALPFLLVFGLLFSSAEVRFGQFFSGLFTFIFETLLSHFWLTVLTMFFSLGLLRSSFLAVSTMGENGSAPVRHMSIGFVQSVTVLASLNVMFCIFVVTQLPYLFGGQAQVSSTPDLAWSEYARRGFFELAGVTLLLVPTLMLFFGCTSAVTSKETRAVNLLCGGLSLLTGIIIVSAFQRMMLYTQNYGLTELRVYVSVFIVVLAVIIAVLNGLNLMGRAQHFVPAALMVGFAISVGMQSVNVQGMVARDIIARHQSGRSGDLHYLNTLSADAVPVILSSGLPAELKDRAVRSILPPAKAQGEAPSWLEHPYSVVRCYSGRWASMLPQ